MMRQPPVNVPSEIAVAETNTTQVGTWKAAVEMSPLAISASVITPIVFCASLVPCDRASSPPGAIWPSRKPRPTEPGRSRPTIRYTIRIETPATTNATSGAISAGTISLSTQPLTVDSGRPLGANTAPTSPPTRA